MKPLVQQVEIIDSKSTLYIQELDLTTFISTLLGSVGHLEAETH